MGAIDDVNSYKWDYCSAAQLTSPWSNKSLRKKSFFITEAVGGFRSVLSTKLSKNERETIYNSNISLELQTVLQAPSDWMKRGAEKTEKKQQSQANNFSSLLPDISKWRSVMWWGGDEMSAVRRCRKTLLPRGFWVVAGVRKAALNKTLTLSFWQSISVSPAAISRRGRWMETAQGDGNSLIIHRYHWLYLLSFQILEVNTVGQIHHDWAGSATIY